MTHICVSKLTIIGSDNGLSPGRPQAIIRTNAGILLIGTLGTNFSEILSEIHTFSFKKMHLKMSSGRWRPFCLGLNVLNGLRLPADKSIYHSCRSWQIAQVHHSQIILSIWNWVMKSIFSSSHELRTKSVFAKEESFHKLYTWLTEVTLKINK